MISVIVPVYNVEKYICQCLDSIVNQTYRDLEIILVDDGSPDNCGKICDEYAAKDKRIKVIHQRNGGPSAARNAGLEHAEGEFIAFIDSDDTIEADMMETLIAGIDGVDIAICGMQIVQDKKIICINSDKNNVVDLTSEQIWNTIFCCLDNAVWNKLYRAKYVKNCKFPEGICHGEDLLFHLQYLPNIRSGRLIAAPKYNYYKRENSITTQQRFTEKAFDEVMVKDLAREVISKVKPEYNAKALLYSFVARMNVIRKICKYKKEETYEQILDEYNRFLNENYKNIKGLLGKRKIEYFLYKKMKPIYIGLVRRK